MSNPNVTKTVVNSPPMGKRGHLMSILSPEAQLFSLDSDSFSLPYFIVKVSDEIVHESPLDLGSKLPSCDFQHPFESAP